MTEFKNKTALITGGASGIGLLMAEILIQKEIANLIILDIDRNSLSKAEAKLKNINCQIYAIPTDLANEQEITLAVGKIKTEGLEVDILINNAGLITGKNFLEHSLKDIERDMSVNSIAPMKLTHELLPAMIKNKSGHIVNISSGASMLSNPGMSVYCASKWAVTGWSDSLRLEMERQQTGVYILTVTPYYIDTGMFEGVRSPLIPILKPEKVAKRIIKAIGNNRIILRTPSILYTLPLVKGILPKRIFDFLMEKVFGVYSSIDKFKGRQHGK